MSNMSKQYSFDVPTRTETDTTKVRVTELISRMHKEQKIEKKKNLTISVIIFSTMTVVGIILTV